jgi:hypothetical protein
MIDVEALADDVAAAVEHATALIRTVPDTGSINQDSAVIPVGKGKVLTRRSERLEAAFASRGVDVNYRDTRWCRGYHVGIPLSGQAARNTAAAEGVVSYLKVHGWEECYVFYMLD